jgi:DSF synthase
MNAIVDFPALANPKMLRQVDVEFDVSSSTMYWWMRPSPRPCFNGAFLEESANFERRIEQHQGWISVDGTQRKVENAVFGSAVPGVYNLGGDLSLFMQAILRKDREVLAHYGSLCIDNMYRRIVGYGANIATYSLLQGKAFGGGFECALASETIIAERSATMCFPEVLFNMFPGMGAVSLLARRVGMRKAEEIIMSGAVYTAKEMYDFGVIDELVEDGMGREAAALVIKSRQRRRNAYAGMTLAKQHVQPVSHSEMQSIVGVWVEAALNLETRDLRMMARLVKAQDRLMQRPCEEDLPDHIYDDVSPVAATA